MNSSIFEIFTVLGLVTDKTKPIIKNDFIYALNGNTFHCYNINHSGPQLEKEITCMEVVDGVVWACVENEIYLLDKKIILQKLTGHFKKITNILAIGDIVLTFDIENRCIVWEDKKVANSFKFEGNLLTVSHPSTYVDKILIGTQEGDVFLYNYKSEKIVYRFKFPSSVNVIECSPFLDIVAFGLGNGEIFIHNIKTDKVILHFTDKPGPIKGLSFRTDKFESLISGNGKGDVAIWDLNEQKLVHQVERVHNSITFLHFLPKEPLLITAGEDNCIKQYIFDRMDKMRVHREISGNSLPPHFVRFYGENGNWILSVDDQMKWTSASSSITRKFKASMKLPKIVDFDFCFLRQDDWDNLVTCHNTGNAYLWNVKKNSFNEKKILTKKGNVKCVKMSVCGNFAVLGRSTGAIEKWNVQSGTEKLIFKDVEELAHAGSVTGLSINRLNTILVSSSLDGKLKFWNFESGKLLSSVDMQSNITKMITNPNSTFVALMTDDNFNISLFDILTMKLFRKLTNIENSKMNDMIFTNDSKYLITCNMEGSIFVWDLISSSLVNWIKCNRPAISLSFHPEGLFLASSHLDSVGIYLWINKLLFGKVTLNKTDKPIYINESVEHKVEIFEEPKKEKDEKISIEEQAHLMKNSGLSRNYFQQLMNLEELREKSKLVESKTKIIAPFFLSREKLVITQETNEKEKEKDTNNFKGTIIDLIQSENRVQVMDNLKKLSPKQVDLNIRTLSALNDLKEHKIFLDFLIQEIESMENFDFIQSMLNVFLNVHSEIIINSESEECFEKLEKIKQQQKKMYEKLNDLITSNVSLIKGKFEFQLTFSL